MKRNIRCFGAGGTGSVIVARWRTFAGMFDGLRQRNRCRTGWREYQAKGLRQQVKVSHEAESSKRQCVLKE
jgi:hypothetical protein